MSEVVAPVPLPVQGVHPELDQGELPPEALHDAQNWLLRDGRMRTRDGVETIGTDTDDRPNGFFGYIDADASEPVLLMGTDDTVFVFDDATQDWDDLSAGFTATVAESTIFEAFMVGDETTILIQNGKDEPQKWVLPDAGTADITGHTMPAARAMMILADRVILGNLANTQPGAVTYAGAVGPAVVTVSAALDPENGYDLTDGLVAQLLDTPGAIVAMREIGSLQGVIYKTDAIYLATASGDVTPFTFELKRAGIKGPVSERAVVVAQDARQYYLAGDGNVMVFDGIEPVPLPRHIQRYVLNTWDPDTAYKAHGVYDDENREIRFFYPGVGSAEPNMSIIVRLDDMTLWPQRYSDLRITAAIKASLPGGTTIGALVGDIGSQSLTLGEYDALGQSFLFGESGGKAYREGGSLDDATPIEAYFETGMTGFNDPLRFKSMKFIDHEFTTADAAQDIDVILMRSNYGETPTSDTARTLDVGDGGPYKTHHRFPGRNYALRMSATVSSQIEWHGATAVYANQGTR